jgi:hypothetical protein
MAFSYSNIFTSFVNELAYVGLRATPQLQSCQNFLVTTYLGKQKNIPNDHYIHHMAVKNYHTAIKFSNSSCPSPSKIYPNFGYLVCTYKIWQPCSTPLFQEPVSASLFKNLFSLFSFLLAKSASFGSTPPCLFSFC